MTDHDDNTTATSSAWSNLLDYLPPDELAEVLGPRGQMMLEREIQKRPSVLMNDENLDALIVEGGPRERPDGVGALTSWRPLDLRAVGPTTSGAPNAYVDVVSLFIDRFPACEFVRSSAAGRAANEDPGPCVPAKLQASLIDELLHCDSERNL